MTAHGPILVETMVAWIHPQVMIFLGKVKNPMTERFERNLPAARMLIDVLAELEEKTEGRLGPEEQRLLKHALTELRLNWIDESAKPAPAEEKGAAGDIPASAEGTPAEGHSAAADAPADAMADATPETPPDVPADTTPDPETK